MKPIASMAERLFLFACGVFLLMALVDSLHNASMRETLLIIFALGGWEWKVDRDRQRADARAYAEDRKRQDEQLEVLNAIAQVTSELNDKTPDPPKA